VSTKSFSLDTNYISDYNPDASNSSSNITKYTLKNITPGITDIPEKVFFSGQKVSVIDSKGVEKDLTEESTIINNTTDEITINYTQTEFQGRTIIQKIKNLFKGDIVSSIGQSLLYYWKN
jgi:hypothetical protein